MLELPDNHSVPERTTDLRAPGQLENIDSLNLNHSTRRGLRSPRGSLMASCAPTDSYIVGSFLGNPSGWKETFKLIDGDVPLSFVGNHPTKF